jgi:uncharacterized membrane protein YcaP (DUF421 family)
MITFEIVYNENVFIERENRFMYIQITIELIIGYFVLLFLTKFLGKTQISQITAFDFISALILGEFVGNALFDQNVYIHHILFAIGLWGLLIFFTEIATQKSRKLRNVLEGTPSIVIRKGKIIYEELKKNHLDLNQLQHLLRSKGIFSIRECEYALLETDGTISTLKKPEYEAVTKKDLDLSLSAPSLPVALIMDGEIIHRNLELVGKNQQWLESKVKKEGFSTIREVLYAEYEEGKAMIIQGYSSK